MQFLKIENRGTSPIECFTTLGISTSRYSSNENVIGTFGSGSKHACLLLMRHGINPTIYCGKLSLEWYSKPSPIKAGSVDRDFNIVHYRVKGKTPEGVSVNREERTSYTLEYGEADWDEVSMALREFVSNALDRAAEEYGKNDIGYIKNCKVEIVDDNQVRAKDGTTRIFIPLTPDVQKFYSQLGKRFLHFSQPHLLKTKILQRADRNVGDDKNYPCVYKKGVLVREVPHYETECLYDYNFGNELEMDESRNLDNYTVASAVGQLLADSDSTILRKVFEAMFQGKSTWESTVYGLDSTYASSEKRENRRTNWKEAIKLASGLSNPVICQGGDLIMRLVQRKGKTPVALGSHRWFEGVKSLEIDTYLNVLTKEESKGTEFSPATKDVVETFDEVWALLGDLRMLAGSDKPKLSCFTEIDSCESTRKGFYEAGTVYINTDSSEGRSDDLWMTMLEEVAHHVTGADDNSRDFQNYFIRALMKLNKMTKGQ